MKIFIQFWLFLDRKQKFFFLIIVLLSSIQTILEMMGIAAAIPFVTYLLKPESFSELTFISNFVNLDFVVSKNLIVYFCLVFFSIFLIKNMVIILTNKIIFDFIFSFRSKLFSTLLNNILNQEYLFFVNTGMSKIFNDTFNEIQNFVFSVVRPIIKLVTEILVSAGIFLLIVLLGNFDGLLLIIPMIILVALILKRVNRSIKTWSKIRISSTEKIIETNYNLVNGIKEIILFEKTKFIIERFNNALKSLKQVDTNNNVISSFPKVLLEQTVILIFITIIILMHFQGQNNDKIIIILSFYLAAAYRLVPSMNLIFVSYQSLKFGKPSANRIMEYYNLKKENEIVNNESSNDAMKFHKNLELKNVNFSYRSDNRVLENCNININKNNIIGIFGESGSGKSTFINLLTSLITPNSGDILIDKQIVKSSNDFRKYKNLFSITSQDTFLIEGTIKDNILFGTNSEFSLEKMNKAIKFANLENVIDKLPDGIDSNIGSTFKQLSSGQKQRISIARSIYSERDILIFDEATNALDEDNERIIFKNLKELKQRKTIIIISHNKENLKICDKIFEFKNKTLEEIL